jgi:hypothetical protein
MRGVLLAGFGLLGACKTPAEVQPDLTEVLGPGESRAGVVSDPAALFGGISAEGRAGDVKLYNSRVQFVIQGLREGDYYVQEGGGVVDADIVRPEGQLGRDMVDEWAGMYGFGRLLEPGAVTVVDSGALGGPAIVHVEGHEVPMALVTGALESDTLVPDLGLDAAVDYILWPDSVLLEVRTTLTATQGQVTVQPGDVLMGALEVLHPWDPGVGLDAPGAADRSWSGFVGDRNDLAMAVAAAPGATFAANPLDSLARELQMAVAMGPSVAVPAGESVTVERYYALGRDLAEITDALAAANGAATEEVSGVVTAADGPVAGARVNVLVDGEPYTLAITRDDGSWSAQVPSGAAVTTLAVGRATGRFLDLPDGAAPYGPYAAAPVREAALAALAAGAAPVPVAEGRGVADPSSPLELGVPGWLVIRDADGLPFEARVSPTAADPAVDERLVPDRPDGYAAVGWARDGEVRIAVEPGTYTVLTHRGIRYEYDEETVVVAGGGDTVVDVSMPMAYSHEGWMLGDPHAHASPSGDASIPMEDRLIVSAAVGLQAHFGTDHDHVADYRPLLAPLGIDQVLASVVSDEVSPVLRGHLNIYPLSSVPEAPNGGAWPWWSDRVPDTSTEFARLRERHGDFVLQLNHPLESSGMASAAGWSPGEIGKPDFFGDDFDAVEVLNGGDYGTHLPFWQDAFLRGLLSTPTGVSDSHSYIHHDYGCSATFIGLGADDVAGYSDASLLDAMRERRTVVTRGVFLRQSPEPGSVVTSATTLTVEALTPSWIRVDRLRLIRDGEVVQTVDGTEASFTLEADRDSAYWVVAEGDTSMRPVYGNTPWAMTSPILVDADGDGWEAPLAPLQVE